MVIFFWSNWTVNNSVQVAEDEGEWQTGGLCSGWRIANVQLLYRFIRTVFLIL